MKAIRPTELPLGEFNLRLPVFFPSVSSLKTVLSPREYIHVLYALREINSQFLVSAFDLARSDRAEMERLLADAKDEGVAILMDSGNYESYWKDQRRSWRPEHFHEILADSPCSLAFGFDEHSPPVSVDETVASIVKQWQADQQAAGDKPVIPIIHGPPDALPELCVQVAETTQVSMVAVAERRLGAGVFERMNAVQKLREALDSQDRYIALHLLGTGNPFSIALYSYVGADSFDGLEWCQTVVDNETACLFHLSHADFFRSQTPWAERNLSFHAHVLAHNLTFYSDWMGRLQDSFENNQVLSFLRVNLPDRIWSICARQFGWEIS